MCAHMTARAPCAGVVVGDPFALLPELAAEPKLGPEARLSMRDRFDVSAVWLERRDSNPGFLAAGEETIRTGGGFLEVVGYPQGHDGRWTVTAIYNYVESDDAAAKRNSAGLALSWLLRRNVRLVVEGDGDFEAEGWNASVGTVAAF